MKFIDTNWENRNLGIESCEIHFDENDILMNRDEIIDFINSKTQNKYKYIVFKSRIINSMILDILNSLGYTYVENQITLYLNKKDYYFSDSYKKYVDGKYGCRLASEDEFDYIISEIKKGVFRTDRIANDIAFGVDISNSRYANWAKDLCSDNNSVVYIVLKDDKPIGFEIGSFNGECYNMILSGIFTSYQKIGLGHYFQNVFLNTIFLNYDLLKTVVSINNIAILKLRQEANFKIEKINTVFIKHI